LKSNFHNSVLPSEFLPTNKQEKADKFQTKHLFKKAKKTKFCKNLFKNKDKWELLVILEEQFEKSAKLSEKLSIQKKQKHDIKRLHNNLLK
jgi:hypothetical protein